MSSDSTRHAIGTALNGARDNGVRVEILVAGEWISGHVLAVDGFGVVLSSPGPRQSVIRIEAVSAVSIGTTTTTRTPLPAAYASIPAQRRPYL